MFSTQSDNCIPMRPYFCHLYLLLNLKSLKLTYKVKDQENHLNFEEPRDLSFGKGLQVVLFGQGLCTVIIPLPGDTKPDSLANILSEN